MKMIRIASLAAGIAAMTIVGACQSHSSSSGDPSTSHVDLTVDASSHEIMVGEVVTLTARTSDTYGRDTSLRWTTTAGKLTTEENGRVARVKFDQPGTYSVTTILSVNKNEVKREINEIRVKPLQ